ncbi:MAG: hypothetical protein IKR00_04535 [Lachnospiraceae bacterium]|nr:hypothetical protein [Lachnospiraceae bacterium]
MDTVFQGVFSEYTVKDIGFKAENANAYVNVDGAGSASEEYERRTVTKAKSNVVVKRISRQSGSGTLSLSLHMPRALYNTVQGMVTGSDGALATGVSGLKGIMKLPMVEIVMKVEDEDGDVKYKYYPSAVSASFSRSVDSEADEVAEVDMTFNLSTDAYGMIMYEALASELPTSGALTASTWMTAASSALMQQSA